jgi:hypothetical protein
LLFALLIVFSSSASLGVINFFTFSNMKKLLFVTLLFVPIVSFGQISDYSFSNGQNFELAEFRFWKPNSNNDYKGVLVIVPGFNGDGRKAVLDSIWQGFAAKHNFLIVACHFKDYKDSAEKPPYREVSKGSGEVLLTAIKSFSKNISKNYINDLPLLFFGFSAGGQYNYEFACWKPEKVLSFVVNNEKFEFCSFVRDNSDSGTCLMRYSFSLLASNLFNSLLFIISASLRLGNKIVGFALSMSFLLTQSFNVVIVEFVIFPTRIPFKILIYFGSV